MATAGAKRKEPDGDLDSMVQVKLRWARLGPCTAWPNSVQRHRLFCLAVSCYCLVAGSALP